MDMYPPPVIQKRRSFLGSVVTGFTTIVVTIVLTAGGITLYGMNIVDRKSENMIDIVRAGAANLPELVESLPPVLADVVNHERSPDYARQIEVKAYVRPDHGFRGGVRPVIEVRNLGDEVVSLLTIHVVAVNADGDPVAEWNEYAATPVAMDGDEWRGPLLPNTGTRKFPSHRLRADRENELDGLSVECQITDVRVWRPTEQKPPVKTAALPV